MRVFYFVAMIMAILVLVYALGYQGCHMDVLQQHNGQQTQINKKIGGINEKVVRSSTDDIRRVLCEKYTIGE
jgi:hypothetical protein